MDRTPQTETGKPEIVWTAQGAPAEKIKTGSVPVLIGVSGGPDSMALLDLLVRQPESLALLQGLLEGRKPEPIVCHVNYHHRPTADRDQAIVEEYCRKHGLTLEVLDAWPEQAAGNFQAWAREVRYRFFSEAGKKHQAEILLLAHQQDDLLETWLMQKKRGILCETYGLSSVTRRGAMMLVRPLLEKTKPELEAFCRARGVPYGIDESNLGDEYERNRIRHSIIEELDTAGREKMLEEISAANQVLAERRAKAESFLQEDTFPKLADQEDAWFILDAFVSQKKGRHLSKRMAEELIRQLDQAGHAKGDGFELRLEKGKLKYRETRKKTADSLGRPENDPESGRLVIPDEAALRRLVSEGTEFSLKDGGIRFRFSGHGKTIESFFVSEDDFPLTVTGPLPGDRIELRYGSKKVSRILIDQKVPLTLRNGWPVLRDKNGKVIFLPDTGCDVSHFVPESEYNMVKLFSSDS